MAKRIGARPSGGKRGSYVPEAGDLIWLSFSPQAGREVEVRSLWKSYGQGAYVVRDVSFTLRRGEFLTLLGPSGSGKTTTLMMVAGFETPTRGEILVDGHDIASRPPERRNFGVVFQGYALFPQKTVLENARTLAGQLTAEEIDLVSGGTDNHMMLVDLTNLNITGKDAEALLGRAGITVNKNSIPFETRSPFVTSGIRIGTPAVTTRGMQAPEMREIGKMIAAVLKEPGNDTGIAAIRQKIMELCEAFPLYGCLDRAAEGLNG